MDERLDMAIRAAYIEDKAAEYRATNGALSVPPVDLVKQWIQEATTLAAETLADGGNNAN